MNGKLDKIKADCFLQEEDPRRINALLVQNNRY